MSQTEREQWLERRRRGIGGSDLPGILGLSPWAGPLDIWLDKTGRATGNNDENLRMRMGRELEPVLKTLYQEKTGILAKKGELIEIEGKPFVGTPDLIATDRVVELKTADPMKLAEYGDPGTDRIPENYLVQVQWYMMLTKKQICDLAVLFGLHRFEVYTIHHSDTLAAVLEEAAETFWDRYVKTDEQPPLDASERAKKWLAQKWPRNIRPMVQATDEDDELAAQYIVTDCEADRYATELERIKNLFKDRIGDADGIQGSGWKATWKAVKDSTITDWKAVAEELHSLLDNVDAKSLENGYFDRIVAAASYTKTGARRFLFHTPKNKES